MNEPSVDEQNAVTVFCPQCGKPMRVTPAHMTIAVACPHCRHSMIPQQLIGSRPPGSAPPPQDFGAYSSRSKIVAGLLGILLGGFGAHRFYLGFHGIAVIQIVVSLLTCGVSWIWGLVEGILCLTGHMRDIDDLPLRD